MQSIPHHQLKLIIIAIMAIISLFLLKKQRRQTSILCQQSQAQTKNSNQASQINHIENNQQKIVKIQKQQKQMAQDLLNQQNVEHLPTIIIVQSQNSSLSKVQKDKNESKEELLDCSSDKNEQMQNTIQQTINRNQPKLQDKTNDSKNIASKSPRQTEHLVQNRFQLVKSNQKTQQIKMYPPPIFDKKIANPFGFKYQPIYKPTQTNNTFQFFAFNSNNSSNRQNIIHQKVHQILRKKLLTNQDYFRQYFSNQEKMDIQEGQNNVTCIVQPQQKIDDQEGLKLQQAVQPNEDKQQRDQAINQDSKRGSNAKIKSPLIKRRRITKRSNHKNLVKNGHRLDMNQQLFQKFQVLAMEKLYQLMQKKNTKGKGKDTLKTKDKKKRKLKKQEEK